MTVQTLTPVQFVKDFAGLNITPLLTAPTSLTLEFGNSGREILFVSASAASQGVQVNIGVTVLGQSVVQPTAVTLTSGDLYAFGPYDSQVDQPGTSTVEVTLTGTLADISVALLQMVGAA
jgi:hypothetical protein